MQVKTRWFWIVAVSYAALLCGCSGDPEIPEVPPSIVKARIVAAGDVNPDATGRPSPLVIHYYELKSLGTFEESDFDRLFKDPEGQLGSDLLAYEKIHLVPGESKNLDRDASDGATHIAVIAAYRKLNQANWKDAMPIPKHKTNRVLIYADSLSISVWKK